MAIADEDVERVRAAVDLVGLIGETVGLSRAGTRWRGPCPFHSEKTPSFYVSPQLGFYKCFGCQVSGDVFKWVMETQHLGFVEAVRWLARKAGIELREEDPAAAGARNRRRVLGEAMATAVAWYHERLRTGADAKVARGYLRQERGYDSEVVQTYQLGYAPDAWDELARSLRLPPDVLRDTGLGFLNDRNRPTDSFRARILFPIFDHTGEPVAFGGRQLPGGRDPKYKNSAETRLYRKSEVLYGLNWAKASVVKDQVAVLCEGYTDVIAFHRAGVPTAVATCGTAVTEDHVRRLARFGATRVVLGYDADAAGQGANARFHQWEAKHGLDVRVVDLPRGADPADVGRRDPDALRRAVDQARPFMDFRLRRHFAGADLRSNEGRARAATAAVAIVAEHPDALVRDQYLQQVADETRLPPERVRALAVDQARAASRPAAASRPSTSAPASAQPSDLADEPPPYDPDDDGGPPFGAPTVRPRLPALHPAEAAALWWALNDPVAWLAAASAAGVGAERVEELVALFRHETASEVYRLLCQAEHLGEAVARADAQVAEVVADVATREPPTEQAFDVIVELSVKHAAHRRRRLEAAQRREGITRDELVALVAEDRSLHDLLERCMDTNGRQHAGPGLVAWLIDRAQGDANPSPGPDHVPPAQEEDATP